MKAQSPIVAGASAGGSTPSSSSPGGSAIVDSTAAPDASYTAAPAAGLLRGDWLEAIQWNADGLIPAIAQDAISQRILMVAWMNREALQETAVTGRAVYFSRSRQRLWRKGEESGNVQRVRELRLDCDADVVLLKVDQEGGIACHTGRESCFFQLLRDGHWETTDPVIRDPSDMYK